MQDPKECSADTVRLRKDDTHHAQQGAPADSSRRSFLGKVSGATAALAVALPLEPAV
jgi:hypothetical protein